MKVTDEMVERAYKCLKSQAQHRVNMLRLRGVSGHEHCYPGGGAIRAALEAALAPLPEPGDAWTPAYAAECDRASRDAWMERAEAAEAKLAKVQAWAEEHAGDIFHGQHADLLAILDEAP